MLWGSGSDQNLKETAPNVANNSWSLLFVGPCISTENPLKAIFEGVFYVVISVRPVTSAEFEPFGSLRLLRLLY